MDRSVLLQNILTSAGQIMKLTGGQLFKTIMEKYGLKISLKVVRNFHLTSKSAMTEIPGFDIFLIDDDESVRRGYSFLLECRGYRVKTYRNAKDLLESDDIRGPGCILLDIFLENESGLELQDAIRNKFRNIPIIFITGQGDIPMSVQALKKELLIFYRNRLMINICSRQLMKPLKTVRLWLIYKWKKTSAKH